MHLAPLGHGGPNGVYALVASRQMKKYGLEKSDYGHIAVAQRAWAAKNPYAVYRTPLTMEEYLAAPMVADPLSRYDCVPVVAGAQAIIVAHPDRAAEGARAGVRVRAHRASFNYDNQEGDGLATGISTFAHELWREAGVRPDDIDLACIYDDYPTMVLAQANDLGLIADNDLARFCRRDHRRAALSAQHLGRHAVGRPAGRARRRSQRHFRGGAAVAAPRRRAAGEGRAARGRHRLRHDDVSLRRHRRRGRAGACGMSDGLTPGVTIWRCGAAARGFSRSGCCAPQCHGAEFDADRVHEGVVEEVSVIRHMLGQENWQPRRIASVRTKDGPLMTVGLTDESGPGAVIELFEDGTAPYGRKRD